MAGKKESKISLAEELKGYGRALLRNYRASLTDEQRQELKANVPRGRGVETQVLDKIGVYLRELPKMLDEDRIALAERPQVVVAVLIREVFRGLETQFVEYNDEEALRTKHKDGFETWILESKGISIYGTGGETE